MESIEKRLRAYGQDDYIKPDKSMVRKTIENARQCFYEEAENTEMSYLDFLYEQIHYIKKRWWVLQFFALFLTGWWIHELEDVMRIQRLMGISASLFVIMVIPEIWKSRSAHSLEIEGVSYFSLRQIYAAKMLIFAVVDSIFLCLFAGAVTMTTAVSIEEIVIQFFLPMIVTCCICLHTLRSRYEESEYMACFLSLLWSSAWVLLTLNDKVYQAISAPVWIGLCGVAFLFLTYSVRRVMKECDRSVRS